MLNFLNLIFLKIGSVLIAIAVSLGFLSVPVKINEPTISPIISEQKSVVFDQKEKKQEIIIEKTKEIEKNSSTTTINKNIEPVVNMVLPKLPIQPTISFNEINKKTREATVNILCTSKSGGSFRPSSGTGIIIDKKGVILTNAHIAQYFLLKDYLMKDFIECFIRTGSPARNTYKADILYISPEWINKNADSITKEDPLGTGEDDYAFLIIKENANPLLSIPTEFPFVEIDTKAEITPSENILLAGYPAEFLGGESIQKDLYLTSTIAQIEQRFTFSDENLIDMFSISGNIDAQKGSSGSAVMNKYNKLIGLVSTATLGETTGERKLRAITASYINQNLIETQKISILDLLSNNPTKTSENFNETVSPKLTDILIKEINK